MKKVLLIILVLLILAALVGCGATTPSEITTPTGSETTEGTKGADPVAAELISQLAFIQNDEYGTLRELSYQYDTASHTLTIFGGGTKYREITFFEGGGQVQSLTVFTADGNIDCQEQYDARGNLVEEINEEGFKTVYEYKNDRLVKEIGYYGEAEPVEISTWTYDAAGNPIEAVITDRGVEIHRETWSYDDAGHVLKHDEEGIYGDEEYSDDETFTYNAAGLLTESEHHGEDPVDGWDYRVTYSYDKEDRLIEATYVHEDRGTVTDTYEYDAQGNLCKSVVHDYMDGWITSVCEMIRNDAGQLVTENCWEDYEYSDALLSQRQTTYTYNDAGQLTEIRCTYSDETVSITGYEYDPQGNTTLFSYIEHGTQIRLLEYSYNEESEMTGVALNSDEILPLEGGKIASCVVEDLEYLFSPVYESVAVSAEDAAEIEAVNDYILDSFVQYS